MADPFRKQIRSALAQPGLQAALDANAERRLKARKLGYASLPEDLPTLRKRAHAVRMRTIANLDQYLEAFSTQAEQNGLIVHRAADAAEAVQIVLDIARQEGASLIAKSKTMVGEEIEINSALEEAGFEVVETDLGEYIVQLRGERPAHIITPAVHLRSGDVAQTFHTKLGMPLTDDVGVMTAVARQVLRRVFLNAQIGISGVNFGVAETGALCLLTNEGNGRMVTTLPPVHIALLGIERLVPTLDDLALMLALLPRSATGQKLTVYTSLIHSPRRPDDLDGPRARHVILVDNGRHAIRRSALAESLCCIRCGACLNACPVFQELGGHAYVGTRGEGSPYPGPIGSVISPGLFGQPEFGHLARASSLCGACKEACPVDIDLPKLLLRIRAGEIYPEEPAQPGHIPWAMNLALRGFAWFAVGPRRFGVAQKLAAIFGRLLAPTSAWLRLPALTGWGYSRDFPRPAWRSFRQSWADFEQEEPVPDREAAFEQPIRPAATPVKAENQLDRSPAEIFSSELMALGGTFTACQAGEAAGLVLALLRQRGITAIQAWENEHLPEGLLAALRAGGISVGHAPDPSAGAGLTGAAGAVADSGTLILPGGPGKPQTASLLSEVHIAILRSETIYPTLQDAIAAGLLVQVREAASITLISGPSRTADIEMTLTIGVHGPREVHVFCV